LQISDIDKPVDTQVESSIGETVTPTMPAAPTPETFVEAESHAAISSRWQLPAKFRPRRRTCVPRRLTLKDAKVS
jgi:sec-independent protein translocase protein TatB